MKKRFLIFIYLFTIALNLLQGQSADPVLFNIGNESVNLSEFEYIYNKNNGKDADYSLKTLNEYLALYVKFKLKVKAAREMKVDTLPALIKELEGYRQQLTTNYLNDKEVTDRLAKEVYDRQNKDLLLSHIFFSLNQNPSAEDTLKAYKNAQDIIKSLNKGESWNDLAKKSNDLSTAQKGGQLGWFTAMFPDGFYGLENAAYSLNSGQYYAYPIRTRLGFHVLKVDKDRKAYRKMEAAQIFIKKSSKGMMDILAKMRADSIYKLIKTGSSFEELARTNSDDKATALQGGNIGYFGINQFESTFEDAAFALEKDGDITQPIESSIGYHIIKRLRKDEEMPYERAKRKIQVDIAKDQRFTLAQNTLIEKIKTEANYKEDATAIDRFVNQMDTNYFTYKWKVPENLKKENIFSLGKENFDSEQLAEFVKINTRQRLQNSENKDVKTSVRSLLKEFVSQKCLQYEEGRLEDKYPDFKALMREYREGILLFEATKNVVWDRASEDTTGLKLFYEKNKSKYNWEDRANIYIITVDTTNKKLVDDIHKYLKKKTIEQAINKFDPEKSYLSYQRITSEKKSKENFEGLKFEKGSMTLPVLEKDLTKYTFKKIENLLPAATKTLDEARGYIIADYQDHLETLWVDELKSKYSVRIDDKVLNSIVKK